MKLTLAQALRVTPAACIVFAGAGGKTTAMFQLARQLPAPVIVTATSHLGVWQIDSADKHIVIRDSTVPKGFENDLGKTTLVTGEIEEDRTKPVNHNTLNFLHQFCREHSIPLLIEADGSRGKPLKAWAKHEPPIPEFADCVVQVAGLSGLGKMLDEDIVHRAKIFSELSNLKLGEIIRSESVVEVLSHAEGGQKNIPPKASKVVLLNQADTDDLQAVARKMSRNLLINFDSVIASSLKQYKIFAVQESIAGIILAAGESSRYGQPKQLLDWKGQPFVHAVARTALEAGLSPVIVVTGSHALQVEASIKNLHVEIVRNANWKSGQGSSLREGILTLSSLQRSVGGVIFLLADQPQVTTSILHTLKEKHTEGLYPIVAPMVVDRRANPVLFDRAAFADLSTIEGDTGGRAIFHKHRVEYVPWHDESLLLDVDTPEQYQRLVSDDDL